MASIERECELALINAVSAASVTSYTSERDTARLLPNVTAKATLSNELLGPFTGVFGLSATLTYTARADTGSRAGFDNEFEGIVQELYQSPNLASYMTSHSNLTVYKASINSETGSIVASNRTWKRDISLSIQASASKVAAPFSPTDLSGLSLWVKADAGVTLSGSNVTAWADQSGNGNNVIANTGEEPTFVSSFLNNKPAIQFNGAGQIVEIADSNSLDFINTSAFIVLKYLGQGTANNILYIKNADAGSPADQAMYGLVATNNGNVSFSQNVGGWNDHRTQIDIRDSIPRILSMTYDGINQNVYSNGSFSNTFNIGGSIATSTGLLQIGGYNKSFDSAEYFYGQIAEIIMYNRAVTGTERQQVESYLNTKYAIY